MSKLYRIHVQHPGGEVEFHQRSAWPIMRLVRHVEATFDEWQSIEVEVAE